MIARSIVIPIFNEQETLPDLVDRLDSELDNIREELRSVQRKPSNFWGGQVAQAQQRCCGVHGNGKTNYRASLPNSGSPRQTENELAFSEISYAIRD